MQRPLHLNSRGTPTRCIGFIYCWQTFFLLCLNQKRIRNATTVNTVGNSLKLQEKHIYIVNIQNIHEKILKAVKYRLGILFVNFGTRVMIMNRSRLKCLPTNKYKVSVALSTTSICQLNFILCYLSVLKEKKSDGKLVRNELKLYNK